MTHQDEIELMNILGALICIAFPDAIKIMAACYNEISKEILDMLLRRGLQDDSYTEKVIGDTLMHLMREGMIDELIEKDKTNG